MRVKLPAIFREIIHRGSAHEIGVRLQTMAHRKATRPVMLSRP
jgi:hypothetical protein